MSQRGADGQKSQRKNGTVENPKKFKGQDFNSIRDLCIRRKQLFEDDMFPANQTSLGKDLLPPDILLRVIWKRPTELHRDARFLVDGASIFDIMQGELADCWVLSAVGALTLQRKFLDNVVPRDQEFTHKYAGIFHFRFWQFGEWVDVVVDDRLPTLNGNYLSVQPRVSNEFWPSLLEKAYAKLRGSYQNLHWGFISEALVDFTGGVQMDFHFSKPPSNLQDIILAAVRSGSLMGCTTPGDSNTGNLKLQNGLVLGHAYTVTDATQIECNNRSEEIVRIWNPWGKGEWNGRWSDEASQWDRVRPDIRKKLNVKEDDGQFWMSCQDFTQNYAQITICNVTPSYLDFGNPQCVWETTYCYGNWEKGNTAGGCCSSEDKWKNPQYVITVPETQGTKKGYNLTLALMQSFSNEKKNNNQWLPIGFSLYKVTAKEVKNGPQQKYSRQQVSDVNSSDLELAREVTRSYMVAPGTYLIIPFTRNKGQESEFLLRIFIRTSQIADDFGARNSKHPPNPKAVISRNEDVSYENIFARYVNQGSEIYAEQLHLLLNEVMITDQTVVAKKGEFGLDSCRSMLMLMDINGNGKLSLKEFGPLWKRLNMCKNMFRDIDVNQTGYIDKYGLSRAVQQVGFSVSDAVLNIMFQRYANFAQKMNFANFVCCIIRLETVSNIFKNFSKDGAGLYLSSEQWLQFILSS